MIVERESSEPCRRICVTPVRNESWIIDKFVAAARLWADDIIVADQLSTDGTREQLAAMEDVRLVLNDRSEYDEAYRQRLLLEHARKIPGRRVLIGLDADEALSANLLTSPEWERIRDVSPGTILRFRWVNILPGFERAWIPPEPRPFGFVDDGCEHWGTRIHSPRVPQPANAPVVDLEEVVVLHFQYVDWERMRSKHRWYQAWEHVRHQRKGPLDIFRQYNHMHGSWPEDEIHPVRAEWLEGYRRTGLNFDAPASETVTWWDREVVDLLLEHGTNRFRKIDMWQTDWSAKAAAAGAHGVKLDDPRNAFDRISHVLLHATQAHRNRTGTRVLEFILRRCHW